MPLIATNGASAAPVGLTVTKTASPTSGSTIAPNDFITYTIDIKNSGVAPVNPLIFSDVIPSGTSYVGGSASLLMLSSNCAGAGVAVAGVEFVGAPDDTPRIEWTPALGLSANACARLTFKVQVDSDVADGTSIINVASASGAASATITHKAARPIITATKTVDKGNGTPIRPGDTITYSIELKNTGGAAGSYDIFENIPVASTATVVGATLVGCTPACANAAPSYSWEAVPVPAGGTATVKISVLVDPSAPDGSSIQNQARYAPNLGGPNFGTNTVSNPIVRSVLQATKSVKPTGNANEVIYTITVKNIGHGAQPAYQITDLVPTNSHLLVAASPCTPAATNCASGAPAGTSLTWARPALAPGATDSVSFTAVSASGGITAIGTNQATIVNPATALPITSTNTVNMLAPTAHVTAIKTVSPEGFVAPGTVVNYTVKVRNWGNADIAGPLVFTDVLPAGLTAVPGSCDVKNAPGTGSLRPLTASCTAGSWTLVNGLKMNDTTDQSGDDEAILVVSATVSTPPDALCGSTSGLLKNTVSSPGLPISTVFNNNSTAVVTVRCPDFFEIEVDKSVSPTGNVQPGQTLTYTITAFNPNVDPLIVDIHDPIPSLWVDSATCLVDVCQSVSPVLAWNGVTVPGGQTVTRRFTVTVKPGAPDGTVIWNGAQIIHVASGESVATDEVHNVVVRHNLWVEKVAKTGPITAGQPTGFEIQVFNDGPAAAIGAILTDVLPSDAGTAWTVGPVTAVGAIPLPGPLPNCAIAAGALTCGSEAFNMAASTAYSVTVTSPTTAATFASTPIDNSVTVSSKNALPVTDAAKVDLLQPVITVDKVVTNSGPYALGAPITYDITLTNAGLGNLTNARISEAGTGATLGVCLPSNPVASLAPGAKIVCKATHGVTQVDLDAGKYINTAKGISNELPAGVTGAATVNFTASGSLQVVKTVTSTGPYAVGNNATFSIKVTNTGSVTLHDVMVSEQPDAEMGICAPVQSSTLAPGQSMTCSAKHVVTAADQTAATYHNTATATGIDRRTVPPVPVKAEGSADVATPPTSTSLSVAKTVTSAGPYAVGSNVNFSITVTNSGTAALTGVNVTEQADATLGTCTVALPATLTPGQSFTCSAKHVVTAVDLVSGTYTNVATGTGIDPRGGAVSVTGVASAATPQLSSDMQIIKTLTSDLLAGSNSTWQILVRNAGPGTATGVSVSDVMPAGLTFVSASGSGWSCSAAGSVVTCTNAASVATGADLPPLTVTTKVTATTGTITNVATVSSTSFDAEQANNISSANGPVKAVLAAGPTPTQVPAPVVLPETGSDVGRMTTYGMTLIMLGLTMFVLTRRRPAHR